MSARCRFFVGAPTILSDDPWVPQSCAPSARPIHDRALTGCAAPSTERQKGVREMRLASRWVTHPWVAQGAGVVRFGVELFPLPRDWSTVVAMARLVEALEFDSLWVADHPTTGSDCWTTLAALAMVTTRIRLGSLTSCVFYRHPVVLARMAADVDRISNGRLVLGLGIGDHANELAQLGQTLTSVT